MLITNDYELEVIMKMTGLKKVELLALTKMIITTLGDKGSLISMNGQDITVPAAKAFPIMDPTGAGDAYRAGLLKGLALNRNIEDAAKIGTVAAAYAVENYGTQEHRYTYDEFSERYQQNFGVL
jgi:adenosine kinase